MHRLIATNRYPEFTSRVCPALCEAACTCGNVTGDPVTVKENERAIVEYGYESGAIHAVPPPARTGKTGGGHRRRSRGPCPWPTCSTSAAIA